SPGELAAMVNSKRTCPGALYDKKYHREVREGREERNLMDRERKLVEDLFRKQFGETWEYQLYRLTVDSTGVVEGHFWLSDRRGGITSPFEHQLTFQGPNHQLHFAGKFPPGDDLKAEFGRFLKSLREAIYHKYFGAPAAAPQTTHQLDGAPARQAEAGPQAPVSDDARHYHAVDAVFAAAGAGQAGQAGRKLDATGPVWGPVDARFDFWFPETISHTRTGSGTL